MITISAAKKDDGPAIVQLEQTIWQEENISNIYDMATFIRNGFVYVAKDGERIVGAIVSMLAKQGGTFIVDLIVDPDYRNKKIGYRLYTTLLKTVPRPVTAFIGPEYTASIHLHQKLGFKKIQTVRKPYSQKVDPFILYRLDA